MKTIFVLFTILKCHAMAPSSELEPEQFFTGLLHPDVLNRQNDPETEQYLASLNDISVPDSFDARDQGWIGPPKHQKSCGSCVVFTNVALIESCIARVSCAWDPATCHVIDLSEQEALECGYSPPQVNGCQGALPDSYISWIVSRGGYMSDELNLPYRPAKLELGQCPLTILVDDLPGARITGDKVAYAVDEELLKKLVYLHGAVQTSVSARDNSFKHYRGGIYAGCSTNNTNHGMVLVGYGTEDGEDFWILKNSWGVKWGEHGFMRMKRGVGMCGVGEMVLVVECEHVGGTTSAPYTTTTTEAEAKAQCDLSSFFHGYPVTATNMHLSIQANGVKHSQKVDCDQGMCAPADMEGVVNACVAICGQDPCDKAELRSLLTNTDAVSINSLSVEDFLLSLQDN